MERTQQALAPLNGGNTCGNCVYLDLQPNEGSLCRRMPPYPIGGIIMSQTLGSREPQPAILKNFFFPSIGRPELQWCGEHKRTQGETMKPSLTNLLFGTALGVILGLLTGGAICHAGDLTIRGGTTILRGPAPVLELSLKAPVPWSGGFDSPGQIEYGGLFIGSSQHFGCTPVTSQPSSYFAHGPSGVVSCAQPIGNQPAQEAVFARYVNVAGPVDIGVGLIALNNSDAYNSGRVNVNLLVGWHSGGFSVRYNHISNAGSSQPNLGRDMVLFGWSFL